MLFVVNVLLIEVVDLHGLGAMASAKQFYEIVLELLGVLVEGLARVFAEDEHLTQVRLAIYVAFETVLVTALLFAGLAVPAEALEAFRFELVADVLKGADLGFRHIDIRPGEDMYSFGGAVARFSVWEFRAGICSGASALCAIIF